MWPLDRISGREYLRIGRNAIERWSGSSSALALMGSQALPVAASALGADGLALAIRALYADRQQATVTLLLESTWLPVLLVEVGSTLWTMGQVEPLLRHRLDIVHGGPTIAASDWELRIDYQAGERFALGYAISPGLKQTLASAAQLTGLRWAGLLPAFAWGLRQLRPARRWPQRSGWWVWPEQDRLIVAKIEADRVVAMNSGCAVTDSAAQIVRMVEVERARSGIAAPAEPIASATWLPGHSSRAPTGGLTWVPIAGRLGSQANVVHGPVPSMVRP